MNDIRKVSRGQVWFLVDPDMPTVYQGSVQGKNRPWLVVSNDMCNQSSTVYTVVPLTTQAKTNLPTHVTFNDGKTEQTILCEQPRSVPQNLFYNNGSNYRHTLSDKIMREVDEALAVQFGLQIIFPNSDRYWESLEKLIRVQVKRAVEASKVDAIDISKVASLLDAKVEQIAKEEVAPVTAPVVIPEPIAPIVEPPKEEHKGWVPHKPTRRRNDWSTAKMKEYLDDCDKMSTRDMCAKYGISIQTVYVNKGKFRKLLSDEKHETN